MSLPPVCLARFRGLPRVGWTWRIDADDVPVATLCLLIQRLADHEPGLVNMIARCVLDRLMWVWIPARLPLQPIGRLVFRDLLYTVEQHTPAERKSVC